MCGICGFYGFEDSKLLRDMCEALSHRGPDSVGHFTDKNISLGSTRLAIIDLKTGNQPIFNEDHSICIVFNGEIYNFKDLRKKIEEKGHTFSTNADTEVIIHAYEEFGEECLKYFEGMFAFALWDGVAKKLLLARDRVGIKPLYYTIVDDSLLFASEIKSLLMYEKIKKQVNYNAISLYLSFRYVPGSQTFFDGIHKFPAGHYLIFNNKTFKIKKFWDLNLNYENHTEEFYAKNILQLLKKSINQELVSDVPLGVFASGGLDSSALVSLQPKETKIKTFSVGFEDPQANELSNAQYLAEKYNTEHYETIVDSTSLKLLPKIIWQLDNLIGDPVIIPNYILSELAKKKVKVILCGEGADELFAGYVHHRNSLYGRYYSKILPNFVQKLSINIIKIIPESILNKFFNYPSSLGEEGKKRVIQILSTLKKPAENYMYQISLFTDEDKKELISNNLTTINHWSSTNFIESSFNNIKSSYLLNKIAVHEFKTWLPDYILSKLDYLTMIHSIEGRVPYLDHNLAEFAMKIPMKYKIKGLNEKYILRKALKNVLPPQILKRKKQAFIMPLNEYYKKEINEVSKSMFSEQEAKKRIFYNENYIEKLLHSQEFIHGKQLFALLSLELWFQTFIDQDEITKPVQI